MTFSCIACDKQHESPFNTIYKYQTFMNTCSLECWRITKIALLSLEEKEMLDENTKVKILNDNIVKEIDKAYNLHTMITRNKRYTKK